MALHPDLQACVAAIDAVEADARAVTAGLSDDQANWQPGDGARWSIVQCLDHLTKTNRFYMEYFLPIVERAGADGRGKCSGVAPTWFGRKFVSILEPPVRQKAKAPAAAQPASRIPVAVAVADYVDGHQPYRRFADACDHVDVNRVVAPNPWIKVVRMRVATALLVVPAHDRRHLWQARQVLADPAFPR